MKRITGRGASEASDSDDSRSLAGDGERWGSSFPKGGADPKNGEGDGGPRDSAPDGGARAALFLRGGGETCEKRSGRERGASRNCQLDPKN
jgi:hypothetical protein